MKRAGSQGDEMPLLGEGGSDGEDAPPTKRRRLQGLAPGGSGTAASGQQLGEGDRVELVPLEGGVVGVRRVGPEEAGQSGVSEAGEGGSGPGEDGGGRGPSSRGSSWVEGWWAWDQGRLNGSSAQGRCRLER